MRPLTQREKRIVGIAAVGIVAYLGLFYGHQFFGKRRLEYQQLVTEAADLRRQIQPYESKVLVVKKMMDEFHLDPAKLQRASVVADASAAIQSRAKSGGVQLGAIRESLPRSSGKGLATVQMDGSGQIPAVLAFFSSLDRIGFPVIVDSVQFSSDNGRPGQIKLNLTLTILDFEQWKGTVAPHA